MVESALIFFKISWGEEGGLSGPPGLSRSQMAVSQQIKLKSFKKNVITNKLTNLVKHE